MYPDGGEALMADVEFSHDMGAYGRDAGAYAQQPVGQNSLTTMTNVAGALVSLALIAGVGVWGYKLMVRDVSGIPIVRAAEGEMRVRPEDPGGLLAEHQGLAVNEIAANGQAAGPVDQVTLAPPTVLLEAEDQPIAASPVISSVTAPSADSTPAIQPETVEATAPSLDDEVPQNEIDSLVAELMADTAPRVTADGTKVVGARTVAADAAAEISPTPAVLVTEAAAPAGLAQSVRPKLRPANGAALARPASFTPTRETAEIDPSAIPSGTRLAQLGAYDSPDVARAEWARMQTRFGDILQDKSRVIEEAQSSGRTFYRLRAMGFVDLSDTRRFCSAVKAEGVDCIPVQTR